MDTQSSVDSSEDKKEDNAWLFWQSVLRHRDPQEDQVKVESPGSPGGRSVTGGATPELPRWSSAAQDEQHPFSIPWKYLHVKSFPRNVSQQARGGKEFELFKNIQC